MTAAEMARFIGRTGFISCTGGGLKVEVVVTDVTERWGSVRYQVRPVAGWGRAWVQDVEFPVDRARKEG
jgi:hypothetical protein